MNSRKLSMKLFRCILLVGLLPFIVQCSKKTNQPPFVLATTSMIADLVEQIAQNKIDVVSLMGAGVDPHTYKPTEKDLSKIKDARAIFYNGLHLEGKMSEILERQSKLKPALALGSTIPSNLLIEHSKQATDPHIWFDPLIWKLSLKSVTEVLSKIFPSEHTFFENNARLTEMKIDSLHQWIQTQIEFIPKENRVLITSHDAFSYFGRRYHIQVIGLQGISTVSEFGLQDITKLVDFIVAKKIPAVFIESSVPRKAMDAVIEGASKRKFSVILGGELYSDAMGTKGTPEGTYEGMMKSNVKKIVQGLSKTAP